MGVNSATDALFLALKALGVGPGDEVITVSNSFIATAGAIVAAGARPGFVDVGPDYNMDANLLEAAITSRTRAILPVHLTGNPADMAKIIRGGPKTLPVRGGGCRPGGGRRPERADAWAPLARWAASVSTP